jgi:hypothetical protein
MNLSSSLGAGGTGYLTVLREDSEPVLCRGWRHDGDRKAVLAVFSASEHPHLASLIGCSRALYPSSWPIGCSCSR